MRKDRSRRKGAMMQSASRTAWDHMEYKRRVNGKAGEWKEVLHRLEAGDIVGLPAMTENGRQTARCVSHAARYRGPQWKLEIKYAPGMVYFRLIR